MSDLVLFLYIRTVKTYDTLKPPLFLALDQTMADKEPLATFKLALDLVKAKGIASQNRDSVAMLVHQTERLSIAFTPAKDERPNGLDVCWHGDRNSNKVFDVIWTDGSMPLIVTYRGGAWEKLLTRTAAWRAKRSQE